MERNKRICEPNLDLAQKFDINLLRTSEDTNLAAQELEVKTTGFKPFLKLIPTDYYVLPSFSYQNEDLYSVLSLKNNDYLLCRWHQFLSNVPDSYVKIKLYQDYIKKKPMIRRMQLKGNFYGEDNKLAPVPVSPDPRQFTIHKSLQDSARSKAKQKNNN